MSKPIKYYMAPIQFEEFQDYYRAVVVADGTFTEDDLVQEIKKRNLGIPTNLIKPLIDVIFEIRDEKLNDNLNVYIKDTYYSVSAPGRYDSETSTPNQDKVNVTLKGYSSRLNSPTWERITERIDTSIPVVRTFEDSATEELNSIITPSNIAKLKGIRLDFDKTDNDQGVFFINEASNAQTRVEVYSEIRPSQLIFMNPALDTGNYTLEVRSKSNDSAPLKTGILQLSLQTTAP